MTQQVRLTNHVMSNKTRNTKEGAIVDDFFITMFQGMAGEKFYFETIDQFTCFPGRFQVEIILADASSGVVVDSKAFAIDSTIFGYVHGEKTEWYPNLMPGFYEYQIWVDGAQIAVFGFGCHLKTGIVS